MDWGTDPIRHDGLMLGHDVKKKKDESFYTDRSRVVRPFKEFSSFRRYGISFVLLLDIIKVSPHGGTCLTVGAFTALAERISGLRSGGVRFHSSVAWILEMVVVVAILLSTPMAGARPC